MATPSALIHWPSTPVGAGPPGPAVWHAARAARPATRPANMELRAMVMAIPPRAIASALSHQYVAELPGVLLVEVLLEQAGTSFERRPVGVVAGDRAQIGQLHLEAALVVHL